MLVKALGAGHEAFYLGTVLVHDDAGGTNIDAPALVQQPTPDREGFPFAGNTFRKVLVGRPWARVP